MTLSTVVATHPRFESFEEYLDYTDDNNRLEEAMSQVQVRLTERLATAQIVSIEIPASQSQNPWIEFAGIFKDDPDFAEIARSNRNNRI